MKFTKILHLLVLGAATVTFAETKEFTILSDQKIVAKVQGGMPLPAEKEGITVQSAGFLLGDGKLTWVFDYTSKTEATKVVVDDVTGVSPQTLVIDTSPKGANWSGHATPLPISKTGCPWLYDSGDTTKVFRFTVTLKGQVEPVVIFQPAVYPEASKQYLRTLAVGPASATPSSIDETKSPDSLMLCDVEYLYRWSKDSLHEYTPKGQEDLEKWGDMVSIVTFKEAKDGDALALRANAILEQYKAGGAKVLRVSSVPRTAEKPAEHFMAVFFGQPEFIEVAFARLRLLDGAGVGIVASHREYGQKVGPRMSAWLQKNGASMEKALMAMEKIPTVPAKK